MQDLQYCFEETADGSPTVRLGPPDLKSEAMHSLKGAFSETLYIYGSAMETAFQHDFKPRVLSLGLGLGYVELLAAAQCLKKAASLPPEQADDLRKRFGGESFELVPELRSWFTAWVLQSAPQGAMPVPDEFSKTYDEILKRTSLHTGVDAEQIRAYFAVLLKEGRWLIREALNEATPLTESFGCICFDAFSSKTSPDLWTEPFLLEFLKKAAAPGCVLSTYACTGALKRSLRTSGFDVTIREGFSSKRDSTFAVRAATQA